MSDASVMNFISNLLPAVPSLELDPTSQYQNVTLLQNTFIGAFLGTFLANLGAQAVKTILGQSFITHFLVLDSKLNILQFKYLYFLHSFFQD